MTHLSADHDNLAWKYLRSELSESECEEFELHFFSCPECASLLNERALAMDRPHSDPPKPAWWQARFPALSIPRLAFPAVAMLSTMIAIQAGREIISARQQTVRSGQPLQTVELTLLPPTRGTIQEFPVPPGAQEIEFAIDVPSDPQFGSIRCEIQGSAEVKNSSVLLTPPVSGEMLRVSLPTPARATELRITLTGIRSDRTEASIFAKTIRLRF